MGIDQADHHLCHHILFIRLAFSDHQGQGYQRVIGQLAQTICPVEDAVLLHEPHEQEGGDLFNVSN